MTETKTKAELLAEYAGLMQAESDLEAEWNEVQDLHRANLNRLVNRKREIIETVELIDGFERPPQLGGK
jgi:transposase